MGSGRIESANPCICQVGLKRSGAWWYGTTANQMLALRCANDNGAFERAFARYRQRIQNRSGSKTSETTGNAPRGNRMEPLTNASIVG